MNLPRGWTRNKRALLIYKWGNKCTWCGISYRYAQLELAHKSPTGLKGKGRGSRERLYDVIRNPNSYILLCHNCHAKLDGRKA
jgi:hypothetical protein